MARKTRNDMPSPDDLTALADWLNANSLELIEAVLRKHTIGVLSGVRKKSQELQALREERNALRRRVRALEEKVAALEGRRAPTP